MIYSLTIYFGRFLFWALCGYTIKDRMNVPKKGGVILVSNHASFIDPPLVSIGILHRQMSFMARASLFKHWLFGPYISMLKAFPVERGGADRRAWREFQRKIDNGEVVLMFPEGTRTSDGRLQQANPGSGMLIHRCKKAIVIPVRIFGSYEVWPKQGFRGRHPVSVTVGKPIDLKNELNLKGDREVYQVIVDKAMAAIGALTPTDKYPAPTSYEGEADEGAKAP